MMIRKSMFIADRYEIIDKVGSGGMSDVYKALDHKLNRYVAVKVLKDEFSEDKSFVSKFKVEAQSAAGLAHPNIVNVFDVGDEEGIYFIVMELVEGITLKKYIEKKGKLPVKEAVSIAIQIAQGIEAAHNNHIIHRDIKPQNVIISREGKVKVTDFGIARAASANTINSNAMGSVHYISPEQARGGYIDEKSDIYSLGISLYEMLAGKVPFEGDSTVTIALQHINEEIPSIKLEVPDLPISVEKIIEKCTQKRSEARYLKVAALIADLKKSLITPDEDFVVLAPAAPNGATIMMTDEEVKNIRKGANAAALNVSNESNNDIDDIDNDLDEFNDDIDTVNSKYDKLATIGAIVGAVVILIAFILVIINVLNGCNNNEKNPYDEATSTQKTGISSEQTLVPYVVGLTDTEAQKVLNDSDLGMGREYEYDNHVPKGQIIRQSVAENEIVDKHTKIIVVISNGAKKFDIPSVQGMTKDEAKELLENETYGLNVNIIYEPSEEIEADYCIKTNPTSPTQLTYGAHVDLYISSGADDSLIKLPALVDKNFEMMKTELETLGFIVVAVEEYHETVVVGKIISAEYKEGNELPKGTTINVVVSKGPKPVETTTEEPTTEETTTEAPTVEMITKTEVFMKAFNSEDFKLPVLNILGEDGSVVEQTVAMGTLRFELIVKAGKSAIYDVYEEAAFDAIQGYSQSKNSYIVDEVNIESANFNVWLIYTDEEGKTVEKLVYEENDCITDEVEVEGVTGNLLKVKDNDGVSKDELRELQQAENKIKCVVYFNSIH